jgi:hypothetical protein
MPAPLSSEKMIISASRRTDLPAFYSQWLRYRLEAGFCLVPNPFNPRQISRVSLLPGDVDAFVFWTRDARPFMPILDGLERLCYRSVFLVTLTAYSAPLEPNAPSRQQAIAAFHQLAERVGSARITWRYDPIILGPGLGIGDHLRRFERLAAELAGATQRVKISMIDLYRKTRRRLSRMHEGESYLVDPGTSPGFEELIRCMADTAGRFGMELTTCGEERNLEALGAPPGRCIDAEWLARIYGRPFPITKDRGQRQHCLCAPSRDIGMNDTCLHGCSYCYATRSHGAAVSNHRRHDPQGTSLLPVDG